MKTSISRIFTNKDFVMLWFSQMFSQISLNILSFVLAIEVYRLTLSNTAVSLMLLTFGVPAMLLGVLFGGVVDFYDKRSVLLFCNVSRVFVLILYFSVSGNLTYLYILSIVISIITQLFIPAEGPSIPKLVARTDLLSANSLFTITFFLSTVVGSLTAGPLLKSFGIQNSFLIMAILMALASLFTFRLPRLAKIKDGRFKFSFKEVLQPLYDGFKFIGKHTRIRQSLYLLTFSQSLIFTLSILAPGFADKILLLPLEDVSLVVMGPAVLGLIIGAIIVSFTARRLRRGVLIQTGIILTGVTLVLLSILSQFNGRDMIYFIMFLLAVLGLSNSLINVPASTILQEETLENLRGRVYGVLTSLTGGISVLPVLFSGIIADSVGLDRSLLVIGIFVLAVALYYLSRKKDISFK